MAADFPPPAFDVAFVGSGLSATYTTIRFLERLLVGGRRQRSVALATVERAEEFHTGIPYGSRSGTNALLITSLKDFIPSPERELFTDWLTANRHWMFEPFLESGGALSKAWYDTNAAAIEEGRWLDLYIPRYLFGLFLTDRVGALLSEAKRRVIVTHEYVQAEVCSLDRSNGAYCLQLATGASLQARLVVLALGMPVPLSQFSHLSSDVTDAACFVDDPYLPNVQVHIERMREHLLRGDTSATVLLIGANASTMEMLFRLNDDAEIDGLVKKYVVLSPKGALPERLVDPDPSVRFVAHHLESLPASPALTAKAVYDAARSDIEAGTAQQLTISDTLTPIFQAMGCVVKLLSREEKLEFAGVWGSDLGRFQRRAGTEYSDLVETLRASGRLEIVAARFHAVGSVTPTGVCIEQTNGANDAAVEHPTPMAVIVNCSGSGSLNEAGAAGIVESLVEGGLVQVNKSARGLVLDDDMQANHNLFVVGPLMSGNVIADVPVWHMEHCGRIIFYGGALADHLLARL